MTDSDRELMPDGHNSGQLLDALSRVLGSRVFAEVTRLKKFLDYSVRETMAGRGDRLKGFVIACEVFDKVDPSEAQSTTVVRVEAGRLRRRLKDYYDEEGRDDPIRISIPKGGYAAVFTVRAEREAGRPAEAEAARAKKVRDRGVWAVLIAVMAVLSLTDWLGGRDRSDGHELPPGINPTIAVMPFENLSGGDPDNQFANGLTEDIVIDLGGLSALNVISISSVLPFRGRSVTLDEVASQLSARYVLQGSIRSLPPNLRITARLSDAETGYQLWADRFSANGGETSEVQQELARKVVSSLSISLPRDGADLFGRRYTQNKQAWFLFKQAMNLANPPSDSSRLELAFDAFEQVAVMDPEFAGGFAGTAYIRSFQVFFGHSRNPDEDRLEAMAMASRARDIDPDFGLTYSALAFIHLSQREFEQALAMSGKATEIHPNDPYVIAYHGAILAFGGDLEGGLYYTHRALKLDPLHARTPYLNIVGLLYYLNGNYDLALEALLKNQERGGPTGPGQVQVLAAVHSKLGQYAAAESLLNSASAMHRDISRSENWLLRAFKDPAVPKRLTDEVVLIRAGTRNAEVEDSGSG
jgi:TolB-like protein/Tfp pilus assembly protein PilF